MSDSHAGASHSLRQEARALRFIQLTSTQREAMERLVDALIEAQARSGEAQAGGLSRLLLISGSKGVGKTSILLTLRHMYAGRDEPPWSELLANSRPNLNEFSTRSYSFWRKMAMLKEGQRRLQWLEPLSLDPMPPGTNLVSAVLARIRAVAETDQGGYRDLGGVLDPVSPMERALHMLEGFQSPAVTGLEGNLGRRGDQMDPDSFSIATLASERAKLTLADKLNKVLTRIAAGTSSDPASEKTIFVLPVDDLDVRPSRAVEMLQLASHLAVPRLFFLFFGSSSAIDQMLYYRTQGEYYELLGAVAQARPRELERVEAVSNEVSSSLLRKMIPPGQRVEVEDVSLQEALTFPFGHYQDFGPDKAKDASMEGKKPLQLTLGQLILPAQLLRQSDKGSVCDLLDVLVPEDPLGRKTSSTEPAPPSEPVPRQVSCFYDGAQLLASPVRQLSDIQLHMVRAWEETNTRKQSGCEDAKLTAHSVVERIVQTFVGTVDEDPHLTVPVQQRLKACIRQAEGHEGEMKRWELTPPDVEQSADLGDRMEFALPLVPLAASSPDIEDRADPLAVKLQVATLRRIDLGTWPCPEAERENLPPGERRLRIFGPRTRSAFKVLHDLIQIAEVGSVTSCVLPGDVAGIARTCWDDFRGRPLVIPWMTGRWETFWHQDRALRWWNRGIELTRTISSERAELKESGFAVILALFRAIGVVEALLATGDGKEVVGLNDKPVVFAQPTVTAEEGKPAKWTHAGPLCQRS